MRNDHSGAPGLSPEEKARITRIFRRRAVLTDICLVLALALCVGLFSACGGPGVRRLRPDGPDLPSGGPRALRRFAPAGGDAGGRVFDLRVLPCLRATAP